MRRLALLVCAVTLSNVSIAAAQTFSGSLRTRVETWHWFDTPAANPDYTYLGLLVRAALSDQGEHFGWRIEAAAPVLLGLPDNAVAPAVGQLGAGASYYQASDSAENAASVFIKQAFVRWGKPAAQGGHSIRIGRFEFLEGAELAAKNATVAAVKRDRIAQRLIGNFGWSHVQRSYDGMQYGFDRSGLNVTALAVRPTRGVFDVKGMENLGVGLAYASINGALSSDAADWRLFFLHYRDYREDPRPVKADNRPTVARAADTEDVAINGVGGHYVRAISTSAGVVDVMLWGNLQFGEWGVLDHGANAFAFELGIQPKVVAGIKPWIRAGYYRSSGDDDSTDDGHGTFFPVTPTPRVHARFPFYNHMNLQDAFVSVVVRPSARMSLRADVHQLHLTESADLWYAGGGAFEPQTFGYAGRAANGENSLATTFDLSADYRISDRVSVNGYGAFARGGDVVRRLFSGSSASLGYLEIELRK